VKTNHSKSMIYRVKGGYDILSKNGVLYHYDGRLKTIGLVNQNWKPSGKLEKKVPNELKSFFYTLK
jgi:hypothetical protein